MHGFRHIDKGQPDLPGKAARLYRASRGVTQSGRAGSGDWILDFEPEVPPDHDWLMGWVMSSDVLQQVRLTFPTKEQALSYAERQGWRVEVQEPPRVCPPRRSYAENFVVPEGVADAPSPTRPESPRPPLAGDKS
jgi:hypothetical protein